MGNISVLKRNEEVEVAKRLEEGKEIIKRMVAEFPLYERLEANLKRKDEEDLNVSSRRQGRRSS